MNTQKHPARRIRQILALVALSCGSWSCAETASGQAADKQAASGGEKPGPTAATEKPSSAGRPPATMLRAPEKSGKTFEDAARQPDRQLQVYHLKHASPYEAIGALQTMLEGMSNCSIAVDRRTGNILVSGPKETHERVREALQILDVPVPAEKKADAADQPDRQLKVYRLEHASAKDALAVLQTFLQGALDWRLAVDARSGNIIVSATKETHARVTEVLQILDVPASFEKKAEKPAGPAWVEVYWLMSDAGDVGIEAKELREMIPEMVGKGASIGGLRKVARVLLTTTSDGKFQLNCSPMLGDTPVQWSVNGSLKQRAEMAELQIQISVWEGSVLREGKPVSASDPFQPAPSGGEQQRSAGSTAAASYSAALKKSGEASAPRAGRLLDLETNIITPYERCVMLGIAPTEKMSSVFVIRVSSEKR
jgi:hypothetical protein